MYEEILSFEKGKPEVYVYLGVSYIQLKDYKKQRGYSRRVCGFSPMMPNSISIWQWRMKKQADLKRW